MFKDRVYYTYRYTTTGGSTMYNIPELVFSTLEDIEEDKLRYGADNDEIVMFKIEDLGSPYNV